VENDLYSNRWKEERQEKVDFLDGCGGDREIEEEV